MNPKGKQENLAIENTGGPEAAWGCGAGGQDPTPGSPGAGDSPSVTQAGYHTVQNCDGSDNATNQDTHCQKVQRSSKTTWCPHKAETQSDKVVLGIFAVKELK